MNVDYVRGYFLKTKADEPQRFAVCGRQDKPRFTITVKPYPENFTIPESLTAALWVPISLRNIPDRNAVSHKYLMKLDEDTRYALNKEFGGLDSAASVFKVEGLVKWLARLTTKSIPLGTLAAVKQPEAKGD